MYRPGATVDLKRGERYLFLSNMIVQFPDQHFSFAYTDFALRQALIGFEEYSEINTNYDIACQFSKKAPQRFGTHFPCCKVAIENM